MGLVLTRDASPALFQFVKLIALTIGLPCPFLNNMSFSERVSFYATTIVTGLGFYVAGWILAKLKSKFVE